MQTKGSKKLFDGQSIYVGLDVHSKSWKVAVYGEQYEHKVMSQNPDPDLLARYLKKNFPGGKYHAVYEAGFSGFTAARRLQELGVNCIVIHAADVPTSQKERLQKTDKIDSRKLARALRNKELTGIHIPEKQLEADRSLLRQRFRVVKDITRNKLRVKSLLYQFGINIPERFTQAQTRYWSKAFTTWLSELAIEEEVLRQTLDNFVRIVEGLRKELAEINRQVKALSKSERYKNNYDILISTPGIGMMTAMTLLTEIGDIRRFKRLDELCSFVGLIPRMYGSGEKMQAGKMTKRGRKALKVMLIEASWDAIRLDPALMARFNELSKRMKKNKAIIRIARKLLNRMRYQLLHQQRYVPGVVK